MKPLKFNIMKTNQILILVLLLFSCLINKNNSRASASNNSDENTLTVVCSPDLTKLSTTWITEFEEQNPSIKIDMDSRTEGQSATKPTIAILSNEYLLKQTSESDWKMVVGHNAIVAVLNANNPLLAEINTQGLTMEELKQLLTNVENKNWNTFINKGHDATIHCYILNQESILKGLTDFINSDELSTGAKLKSNPEELIEAVQNDLYALGFCRMNDILEISANEIHPTLKLLPIDKNSNNRIDHFESIYNNAESFTRGVWIGKYPFALCGSVYAVSETMPTDKNALAFLSWLMADGQTYLSLNGYSKLASAEIFSNLSLLRTGTAPDSGNNAPFISTIWMVVFIVLGVFLAIGMIFIFSARNRKDEDQSEETFTSKALSLGSLHAPKGLYFDKSHTWAFMEKDGNVKVGIDDFLQHITGTLTRIKMKESGEKVRKGEKILTLIRDGKQLNIYAPISGVILESNHNLLTNCSLLNTDPYSEGWVYTIEPRNWVREIQFMFMGESYILWLQNEYVRLKEFFSVLVSSHTPAYAHVVMQDGGEITDHVLADMEPEVWEDFQTKFIDNSK
jgi:glycine cleavage system H lipoate-binding protein/ABC-type phosphate transport system substrate-binding protein